MARHGAARTPEPSVEPLMTPAEVMARIGCSRSFVQDHRAELGARKLGGLLRFPRAEVEAFIARGRHAEAPAAAAPEPEPTPIRARPVLSHSTPLNPLDGEPW
jgi:excisionase family DNA binding protein